VQKASLFSVSSSLSAPQKKKSAQKTKLASDPRENWAEPEFGERELAPIGLR
jgi:hypothetical protein